MPARRTVLTVAVAAACLTSASVFAASAGADPASGAVADPTSSVSAYLAQLPAHQQDNQTALIAFNGWLMNDANGYANGYVASVDDPATRSLTLLWNGPADATQHAALTRAAAGGITAAVRSWPYSHSQIEQAADKLRSFLPDDEKK